MIFVVPIVLSASMSEIIKLVADIATVVVAVFSLFISFSMLKTAQKQENESTVIQYKRDLAGMLLCLQNAVRNVEDFKTIMSSFVEGAENTAQRQTPDFEDKIISILSPLSLDENTSFAVHTIRDMLNKLEEYELMAVSLLEQQQHIGQNNAKFVSHFFHAYRLFIIAVWKRRCLASVIRNSVSKCCGIDVNIYPFGHCETSVYELYEDMVKLKNTIIANKILEKIGNILYVQ